MVTHAHALQRIEGDPGRSRPSSQGVHQPFQDEHELHAPVDLRVGLQTAFDPPQ